MKTASNIWKELLRISLNERGIFSYKIAYAPYGKPFLLSHNGIKFNVSHSGDYVVCAISSTEIGIDVEKIRDINCIQIANRFFTTEENNYLNNTQNRQNIVENFYEIWTLKESLVKAIGTGLSFGLKSFSVIKKNSVKKTIHLKNNNLYYIKNLDFTNNYKLSVCQENLEINNKNCKILIYNSANSQISFYTIR